MTIKRFILASPVFTDQILPVIGEQDLDMQVGVMDPV